MALFGVGLGATGCGTTEIEVPASEYASVQMIVNEHPQLNLYRSVLRSLDMTIEDIKIAEGVDLEAALTLFLPSDKAFSVRGQAHLQAFLKQPKADLKTWVLEYTIASEVTMIGDQAGRALQASLIDAKVLSDREAMLNDVRTGIDTKVIAEDGVVYVIDDFLFDAFEAPTVDLNTEKNEIREMELSAQVIAEPDVENSFIAPVYEPYSTEMFNAFRGGEPMVLFFYTASCWSCVEWDEMMQEKYASLPSGSLVFRADFDNDYNLRKEFGIVNKSMAVFVDSVGEVEEVLYDPEFEVVEAFFKSQA
jgi:uncharacterized surface protein with fasciclin (FAS1) repeats